MLALAFSFTVLGFDGGTGLLRRFLPLFTFRPCTLALHLQLIATGAEFGDGLFRHQLLKRPLLNILGLVLLELRYELDSAG